VQEWEEWVTVPASPGDVSQLSDLLGQITLKPARPDLGSLVRHDTSAGAYLDRPPLEHPDWLLNDVTAIAFDGAIIHPAAGTALVALNPTRGADSLVLGSDIAAGVRLTPKLSDTTLAASTSPIGFGVVGGSGASRAILTNVSAFQQLSGG
jgi:hypothetical protein